MSYFYEIGKSLPMVMSLNLFELSPLLYSDKNTYLTSGLNTALSSELVYQH